MKNRTFEDIVWEETHGGEVYHKIMDKHEEELEAVSEKKATQKAAEMFDAVKADYRSQLIKEMEQANIVQRGAEISSASPFITENVIIDGRVLDRRMFIPTAPIRDSESEDIKLYYDDMHHNWLIRKKNGLPKLVSRFVVDAALIVDAFAPGSCRALVVFLRGGLKPLIFWNGCIEPAALRKQTQYQQKGLTVRNRDFYHESFLRALCICPNVLFLTLPQHAGWNTTPEGRRVFVESEKMIPVLSDLFND